MFSLHSFEIPCTILSMSLRSTGNLVIYKIHLASVAQRLKHLPPMWETRVRSLGWEDPLEKEMATTPVILPGKFHGLRGLEGYSPWGRKKPDTTERLHLLIYQPCYQFPDLVSTLTNLVLTLSTVRLITCLGTAT